MSERGSLFFSYAREDADFALRLATDLRGRGVSVWLDKLDILPGEPWDRAVEDALDSSASLLVILSPDAVDSTNVMDEVSFALEEGKRTIPVVHRECRIPLRLRRLQHIDFTASYDEALSRLERALLTPVSGDEGSGEGTPRSNAGRGLRDAGDAKPVAPQVVRREAKTTSAPAAGTRPPAGRIAGALVGAVLGVVYGSVSAFFVYYADSRMDTATALFTTIGSYAGVSTIAGAVAGAIAGRSPRVLHPMAWAIFVVVVAWIGIGGTYADVVIMGLVVGGGIAAILVSVVWTLVRRSRAPA